MKANHDFMLTALIASVSSTAVDAQRLITDYHDSADSLSSGRLIEVSEDDRFFPSAQTVMQVIGEKPKPIVNKWLAPGSVKYKTSVGADGQLNVEVPIESFAAKFEADPGIALNYNGMSAASFMGDGWSITGLHTIRPTERTLFTDGRCSGIDGDGEYAYALDGQRLIKLSENDSCSVFQGQSDLTRAVYYKSADRFSVMYANGQVGLFAKMIDQSYRLIDLTYPDCRKIKYNYGDFISQHSDIESVEYGDGKKITFSYIIAKDDAKNVLTYLGGQKLESVKKIGGITVTFNGKTLLSYRLNYSQESNMHSPVASIELRGKDGSCLNPLKFTYGSTALSDGTSFNSRQQTSAFVSVAGQFITKGKFDTSSGEDGIVEFINKAPYKRAGDLCVNGYNGKEQILITPSLNGYDNLLNTTQVVAEDGFETITRYDAFGRIDSVGDGVGNSKVTHLSWAEDAGQGCYVATVTEIGKPDRREVFDGFNREVQSAEMRPDGLWLKKDRAYDSRGNLVSESLPYTKEQPQFLTMEYDNYGRITRKQWPSGRNEIYSRHGLSTTSTVDGVTLTKRVDPLGRDIEVKRPDGIVKYTLRPDGQPEVILVNGSISTVFEYDGFGRKTAINDPSAGRKEYAYDAAGNVTSETDARGKKVMSQYDKLGRVVLKEHDGVTQSFKYDRDGNIESVTQSDGQWLRYGYDIARRVVQADDNGYVRNYIYADGNVVEIRHALPTKLHLDNIVERYSYLRGTLTEVSVDNIGVLWRLNAEDDSGLPSATSGMGVSASLSYDGDMRLSQQVVKDKKGAVLHDMEYNFDPETGNLMSRTDNLGYGEEQFEYDELNRLVSYGNGQEVEYDEKGNILALYAAEEYKYDSARPYAVNSGGTDDDAEDQRIVFNALQMPDSIMQGGVTAAFTYGCDGQRSLMRIFDGRGNGTDTRYYGSQQFTLLSHKNGNDVTNVAILYLGGTPYRAPVALVNNIYDCNGWQVYDIVRDHLGSISEIVDTAGCVVQMLRYDAWGNLCDPYTQEAYTAANMPQLMLGRGYCGHEHLFDFGLINMNARLYDPAVGRFISPDPQVQLPDNVQNYNRYSYCLNNPLRYRDED